jgi:hypothetical protein
VPPPTSLFVNIAIVPESLNIYFILITFEKLSISNEYIRDRKILK